MGGGQTTTTVQDNELPKWYQEAAIDQVNLGKMVGSMGYAPYIGPDIAAFAPQQIAGMQGASDLAAAFGMANAAPEQMPVTDFGNGVRGYSSFPGYESAVENLRQAFPGLANYLAGFTIDPFTGAGQEFFTPEEEEKRRRGSGGTIVKNNRGAKRRPGLGSRDDIV